MSDCQFYAECIFYNQGEYRFSVDVYYGNKRVALADAYIDIFYGNNIIKIFNYNGKIPGFSDKELKKEISDYCHGQIARIR